MKAEDARHLLHKAGVPVEEIDKQLCEKNASPYISKGDTVSKAKGKPKYKNNRCWCEILKRWFDSQFERTVARRLYARQQAGEISGLVFQVNITLLSGRDGHGKPWRIGMRPDFQYYRDAELITHEAKGLETEKFQLQRRLWEVLGPTEYIIEYQAKSNVVIVPRPNKDMTRLAVKWLISDHGSRISLATARDRLGDES